MGKILSKSNNTSSKAEAEIDFSFSNQNKTEYSKSDLIQINQKEITNKQYNQINKDLVLKIVCISDTHNVTDNLILTSGDILIHAGDFTKTGKKSEVQHFAHFMKKQNFKYKIIIAGNHDICFDEKNFSAKLKKFSDLEANEKDLFTPDDAKKMLSEFIYLENSSVEIFGIKIFGSPIADSSRTEGGFVIKGSDEIRKTLWKMVPDATDILVTHGPPYGICDFSKRKVHGGCKFLLQEVMQRIKPKFHVFGHIHEANGKEEIENITFINCAICLKGAAVNKSYTVFVKAKDPMQNEPVFYGRAD